MKYTLVTIISLFTDQNSQNALYNDKSLLNTDSIRDQPRRFEISGKWGEVDYCQGWSFLYNFNF